LNRRNRAVSTIQSPGVVRGEKHANVRLLASVAK
jgi:hypothetical protein